MRISVYLLPLLATLCCADLTFNKCERLHIKGLFTVTADEMEPVTISLGSGGVNVSNSSVCGQKLTLTLPQSAEWDLVFSKGSNDTVTLNQLFKFTPSVLFNNDTLSPDRVSFDDDGTTALSSVNKSYICETPSKRSFAATKGGNFTVTLTIDSIQVQAFNLPKDGKFSEGEHCAEDSSSTTTPSGPTTAQVPTTAPPEGVMTFRVESKNNKTCILMEAKLEIRVTYKTVGNKTASKTLRIPKKPTVNGTCAGSETKNPVLEVMFGNDSLRFTFSDDSNKAELSQVTLEVLMDERFPNASQANKTVSFTTDGKWNIPLSKDNTFFFCKSANDVEFGPETGVKSSITITELRVQAFNFKGESFSGKGEECSADTPTSPSPSPTTPAPAPPKDVPNNYTVSSHNITCIRMKAIMNLSIPYNTTDKKTKNVSVEVPHQFHVNGNCSASATTQTMQITFFENWALQFVFTTNVSSTIKATAVAEPATSFELQSVSVTYYVDNHFPNASHPNSTSTLAMTVPSGTLKANSGGSYLCNSGVTLNGAHGLILKMTSFQYMAFHNKTNGDFPNDGLIECSADLKDNSVVPIAVGAALAALVVIVLIAYLIGRRRSRRAGYESV